MYEAILEKIRTKSDVDLMFWEIDQLMEGLYENKGLGFKNVLRTRVRNWLVELLEDDFTKGVNKKKYLRELKEKLMDLRQVEITIAFEPSYDALTRISRFLKKNIGPDVIVNLNFDPNIIGGAQIIFSGNYRDFSFKKAFEKEFERSRGKILKTLRKNEEVKDRQGVSSTRESVGRVQDNTGTMPA